MYTTKAQTGAEKASLAFKNLQYINLYVQNAYRIRKTWYVTFSSGGKQVKPLQLVLIRITIYERSCTCHFGWWEKQNACQSLNKIEKKTDKMDIAIPLEKNINTYI